MSDSNDTNYIKKVIGFVGEARAEKYRDIVFKCFENHATPKQCSKSIFYHEKTDRFLEMNKNKVLHRGDQVRDRDGWEGIVVRIWPGTDNVNHGTIYVWQENRGDDAYGADNCEHYSEINWRENLEIIDSPVQDALDNGRC